METKQGELTGSSTLAHEIDLLLEKRRQLLISFVDAANEKKPSKMNRIFQQLKESNEFLGALERIRQPDSLPVQIGVRRYAVSSLFLHESFKLLTADELEQFVFLRGSTVVGVNVLGQILEFQHAKRSVVAVVGNDADTHRLLIRLEQFGHRLLGHFHSHPGNGLDATHPSGTDTRFQKRLEDAGYPSVAAIFSRDGFVRFFRIDQNLEIQIHGSGVEQHEKNCFRLTN